MQQLLRAILVLTGLLIFELSSATDESLSFALNRGIGISGKHDAHIPVLLLHSTPPYVCGATTLKVTTQKGSLERQIYATTIQKSEPPCQVMESYFLAIVGQTSVRFDAIPHLDETDSGTVTAVNSKIQSNPTYENAHKAAREYIRLPKKHYLEPKLRKVFRLDVFGSRAYLARYSAISGVNKNTYFLVINDQVLFVGEYDISKENEDIRFFSINGQPYIFVHGYGQGGNYRLDLVLAIGKQGLRRVFYNDDFAT